MRYILAVCIACMSSLLFAQAKTPCLDCHNDNGLTQERNGKQVSLFVEQNSFKKSVHGELECTDCHSGFDADNIPHKEGKNISKVDCSQCHDTGDFSKSIHAQNKLECYACHSKHDIKPAAAVKKNQADLCLKCHKSPAVTSYKQSIHFQKTQSGGKAPLCIDCHNQGAHKIQKAPAGKANEEKLCSTCHKQSQTEFSHSVHSMTKGENTPGCVSCHGAHQVYNNKYSISSQSCLKCHLDPKRFQGTKSTLIDFVQHYKTSIHGRIGKNGKEAATCIDCHGDHTVMGTDAAKSKIARQNIPETCGKCHADELKDYKTSEHGSAFFKGVSQAPNCVDCHGEHSIAPVKESSLSKVTEKDVCFNCHVKNPEVVKMTGHSSQEVQNYEKSAHYRALKNGNLNAPTCSDCHSAHKMQKPSSPNSTVSKHNVALSCGKMSTCHAGIKDEFLTSVHGKAVMNGNADAPTCINCHGNHQIIDTSDPNSRVSSGKQVVMLCSSCHGDVQLSRKYNLPEAQSASYLDSYHGLAVRGGSKFAADCASCHGTHNIKPSSDSTSTISQANLSKTCGQCHPGANLAAEFKKVHLKGTKEESAIMYWMKLGYVIMIVVIIGGMLLHNILDFIRKRQEMKKHKKEIEHLKKTGKVYLRMSRNERIQHFIMLTSFISLVLTGFALKYPESWWVFSARTVLGDIAFQTRSIAHRFFGIAMILVSLYHMYYLGFTKRGRQMFIDMLPKLQDAKDVVINVKYLLGISKEKPYFDRFSYMEKAEYWALVWGVIVMSASGLVLMFNNYFLSIAPKIATDIATIVHLYEAWLATLAIIVWHFYFVIFNPEVYPINKAFIKGTLSEEEMEAEHPKELDRIRESQKEIERIIKD